MKAKYSFLLAAFKSAYLKETIDSILSQTYRDFRLVVSDDCSPENIKEIVDSFNDNRVEYIKNDKNIGGYNLVDHWNLQLQRDCGSSEFVIMASDDDVYDPLFLERIDSLTKKYPSGSLFRGRCVNADAELNPLKIDDPCDEFQSQLKFSADMYNQRHIRCFANFVFKVKTLKSKGGFVNFPYAWYSDVVSTLMMADNGVAHTNMPVFIYRGSSLAISANKNNKDVIRGKLEAALLNHRWMDEYINNLIYDKNKLNQNLYKELIVSFRHDSYATIVSYLSTCSLVKKYKIYKSLKKQSVFGKPTFWKEYVLFKIAKFL